LSYVGAYFSKKITLYYLQKWEEMCTFAIPNRTGKSKARGGAEDEERIGEEQKEK
jgi:hypothetical protein